jgi:hypothetical protein
VGRRPSRADLLRSTVFTIAGALADESERPPSPDVGERHREEWPALWGRIDDLGDTLDELRLEVGSVFVRRQRP